ncbi:MAG: DMT family transporter [Gammaproteobacteria bacterium]|nr:MAG: DMT family transporter [Gammaproteobacteria bacterium]
MTSNFIVAVILSLCITNKLALPMHTRLAVIVLFMSSIGWGLTWIPVKSLNVMGMDSLLLIFIAFASGSLVLAPWLIRQYAQWRSQLTFMMMIAVAGGFANVAFQMAIYHGDVIRVMILFYMLPIWSVLGGRIFLHEKIDGLRILAVLACLGGALLILDVGQSSWQGLSWVDVLAIGSGMGLAATNILFRFTQQLPVMSKVSSMFIGCTVMIAVMLVLSSTPITLPQETMAIPLAMAYGALWLTLTTTGTQWGVTQMEAGRSSVIIVMELVAAVVSAAILSQSALTANEILGGVLVLIAAIMEGSRNEESAANAGLAKP